MARPWAPRQVPGHDRRRQRPSGNRAWRAPAAAAPGGRREARRRLGIGEYEVLEKHGGELLPTIEARRDIVKRIRDWRADIVVTARFDPQGERQDGDGDLSHALGKAKREVAE